MKKNISINISGIIFHIEEDGYTDLKNYLESINKYFSTYDGNAEIIADIESRIAEIFLGKLDDHKQIIVLEDVKALVQTMGTIADFEAIEEDEPKERITEEPDSPKTEQQEQQEKKDETEHQGKRRLHRDEKRRVIGGVAAGIGHYLGIDPLWVRLVMVVLFLNLFFGPLSGAVFFAYIVLWIVVPGSSKLSEDEQVKKMFRDSDSRVLGGVASGIAAYFGIDVTIVRLLFVLSIFLGGTGLIVYIIFWIITPEAKSITEKMQMQGEPVTLSNIQQSVKKNLSNEEGQESPFAKVLLFPFRILAIVFEAIGKILGPVAKVMVDVLRVFAGLILVFVGLAGMGGLILASGVMFGLFTTISEYLMIADFPLVLFAGSFSPILYIAVFVLGFIPMFIISILGLSVLAKRMVIKAPLAWSMFGLWIVGLVTMGILVPATIAQFSREGEYKETRTFDPAVEPVVLKVNYLEGQHLDRRMLRLKGSQDSVFTLVMDFGAQGTTRTEAIENARMITYGVVSESDQLIFDSSFDYKEKAKFRGQRLDMTLYIPFGYKFKMEDDMLNILNNTISRSEYHNWQVEEENTWIFEEEEGLVCLTCPKPKDQNEESEDEDELNYYPSKDNEGSSKIKKDSDPAMTFDLRDFEVVDLQGVFNVYISQSDDYKVQISGNSKYKEDVMAKKIGNVLEISMRQKKWEMLKGLSEEDRLNLYISLPKLVKLKGSGFSDIKVDDFKSSELSIDLSGGSLGDFDLTADELTINMDGGSRLDLDGSANYVSVEMSGASTLRASDMNAKSMKLKATGVSNARVKVKEKFVVEVDGLSNVRYAGNPDIDIIGQGGLSSVQPTD